MNPLKTKGKRWLALGLVATAIALVVPPVLTLIYHLDMGTSIILGFGFGIVFGNIMWPAFAIWRLDQ